MRILYFFLLLMSCNDDPTVKSQELEEKNLGLGGLNEVHQTDQRIKSDTLCALLNESINNSLKDFAMNFNPDNTKSIKEINKIIPDLPINHDSICAFHMDSVTQSFMTIALLKQHIINLKKAGQAFNLLTLFDESNRYVLIEYFHTLGFEKNRESYYSQLVYEHYLNQDIQNSEIRRLIKDTKYWDLKRFDSFKE